MLVLALCGMSSRYTIKVVQRDATSISFHLEAHGQSDVKVNTFLVVHSDNSGQWDYKNPVWAFELPPGSSMPLSNIQYGQAPAGFKETTKAVPLVRGNHYLAVGIAPGSGGSAEFVAK